jgi:Zn-dependent alcohol dehydrogenase
MKTRVAIVVSPEEPLAVGEMEVPEPGPNQVIVKLISSGICLSQIHEKTNTKAEDCPHLIGHEGTGVVTHVGSAVTHLGEGDSAIVTWVPRAGYPGREFVNSLSPIGVKFRGELAKGAVYTFGEDVLAHEQQVVRIPVEDATPESCIVGCAVLTGAGAVLHTANVRPEDSVVVIGAGGIGLSAIKMASLLHAYPVIAVDVKEEKLEFAKGWGATHWINSTEVDPIEAVREITGGGADFAFDAVGTRPTHELLLPMVRGGGPGANNIGGMAVLIGWPQKEMTLDPGHFVYHQRQYRGSHGSSIPDRDFPMYLRLHREGHFPLDKLVTKTYKLDEAQGALDDLKAGAIAGRAIILF